MKKRTVASVNLFFQMCSICGNVSGSIRDDLRISYFFRESQKRIINEKCVKCKVCLL